MTFRSAAKVGPNTHHSGRARTALGLKMGANFVNVTLVNNYTYVVGDGQGNGPRTVWIPFLNGQSCLVSPDSDTAFLISTQHGLWIQMTVIDSPPDLDRDFGESAAQALMDDNEVIRNFLTNASCNNILDVEEAMEESSV
jgi:hypothetical protein